MFVSYLFSRSAGAASGLGFGYRLQFRRGWGATSCCFSDFMQLRERAFAVDGALAIGEESLPCNASRIGDPLLVGAGIATDRVLLLDDRLLGAAQAFVRS